LQGDLRALEAEICANERRPPQRRENTSLLRGFARQRSVDLLANNVGFGTSFRQSAGYRPYPFTIALQAKHFEPRLFPAGQVVTDNPA
jgi:hypothetical protein